MEDRKRPVLSYARPGMQTARFRLGRTLLIAAAICIPVAIFWFAMLPDDGSPRKTPAAQWPQPPMQVPEPHYTSDDFLPPPNQLP